MPPRIAPGTCTYGHQWHLSFPLCNPSYCGTDPPSWLALHSFICYPLHREGLELYREFWSTVVGKVESRSFFFFFFPKAPSTLDATPKATRKNGSRSRFDHVACCMQFCCHNGFFRVLVSFASRGAFSLDKALVRSKILPYKSWVFCWRGIMPQHCSATHFASLCFCLGSSDQRTYKVIPPVYVRNETKGKF